MSIDATPTSLAAEIARVIEGVTPSGEDIVELQRQLLSRHAELGLEPKVSSEEVVESFFRCLVIDHLQRRFELAPDKIPDCVNSSHTATRRVCAAPSRHDHHAIEDSEWASGWLGLQDRNSEVQRTPRRADLYVVARGQIVSVEFKYVGRAGLRDIEGCAEQMRGYARIHAATVLVIYSDRTEMREAKSMARLRGLLVDSRVPVICVCGPAITA